MALSEETLLDIIERGDIEACAHFFDAASEADRGGVAKTSVREYQKRWNASLEETRSSPASIETAKLAVIAAARLSDFKRLSAPVWINEEHEVAMLATRPPALIQGLVEWFVEDNPHMVRCVLHLVEAGLCRQPEHENFLLGLMAWWGHADEEEGGLIAILRAHPEFLEHDLWRLLGTEGNGEWSLAAHDKYSVDFQRWDLALVGLSEEASVSRDKLLDTTLDVLARDFAQFRSSWYSRLHEALRPTIDERARRAAAYMRLLGSSISPTVSFALKALAKLDKAKRLEPAPLLAHIGPALTAKTKSSAALALRLVGRAAASAEHKVDAALLIAAALDHESADIQGRALDMLERLDVLDEDEVREAVAGARDLIAPSVRKRLDMLLPPDLEDATPADIEPLPSEPVERTLGPVRNLDDLVMRYAHVLENPEDVEEVEQVLGGLSSLCAERPEDWERRVGPLSKRAARLQETSEDLIQHDMACLALCWSREANFEPGLPMWRVAHKAPSTADLFRERLRLLSSRVRVGTSAPLLSCPTYPRGWIAPEQVVDRITRCQAMGVKPDVVDAVLALLRLGHDGRADARARAADVKGELGHALRYALGSDRVKVGRSAPLWIAAARARDPNADHPLIARKHKRVGPDGAEAARYRVEIEAILPQYHRYSVFVHREPPLPKKTSFLHPTVLFHSGRIGTHPGRDSGACGRQAGLVRWSATIAPGCLEAYFSVGVERIDLDWWEVQWEVRSFFEPMLEPDVTLGAMAHLLIAMGLGAKEPGQLGMAVDVFVTAAEEGRLDVAQLGKWMGLLFPSGVVKARRWAQTLRQAAHAGSKPAQAARVVAQAALRGEQSEAPRDLSYLFDTLHELLVEAGEGLTDPDARTYLEGVTTGGKTGRLRRQLLAL